MGTGYTRQSAADLVAGAEITAGPLNAEFNQLRDAFDATTGASHDGTVGEGPKIALTTSISGVLPVINGGFAGIHKTDATTAPTTGDDTADGYAVGSTWIDTTNDKAYVALDVTLGAAVWALYGSATSLYQPLDGDLTAIAALSGTNTIYYRSAANTWTAVTIGSGLTFTGGTLDSAAADAELAAIAALTSAANKGIYFTGVGTAATYDFTAFARTMLDDADADTVLSTLGVSTFIKTLLDDANATAAKSTLGLVIGTNVQAWDADLDALAGLTSAANKIPYFTGSGTAAVADFPASARTAFTAGFSADVLALLDDANFSAMRTSLGLAIGTNVQAWDTDLDTWATKTAPSGTVLGTTDTQTLTNKRITPRVSTEASNATPAAAADSVDIHTITALAAAALFGAPTGTPTDGQKLIYRIKDNGTARALTYDAIYRAMGTALPTTTVISKTLYLGFIYNSADSKWDLIAAAQEA